MAQRSSQVDDEEVTGPVVAALIGMLLTGLLYLVLPANVIIGPNWLLLVVEGAFVIPLLIDIFSTWDFSHQARRILVLVPLSLSTLALVVGVVLLVTTLAANTNAIGLLRGGALLWSFNILVFGLWYWEIDGEGPWKRHFAGRQPGDFLFPQQTNDFPQPASGKRWMPHFLDYLFVAFTGATALSPADTFPLTRVAKTLMMLEALISITVAVIIVARAVNILGK